jgi:hypothetical protein
LHLLPWKRLGGVIKFCIIRDNIITKKQFLCFEVFSEESEGKREFFGEICGNKSVTLQDSGILQKRGRFDRN